MRCVLVSHTHWDREWYRTFQGFRARLVDAVDRVLALCDADPDYRFVLDGQAIVLEDYLEIRPERREALAGHIAEGRIAIGPWYVQPDSLLPSGEAHLRNLLEGRRVAEAFGPASRMGYTPDSFGHPAQFPQLFRGFGLVAFIYWRGNGNEIDELPSEYLWEAPDGSSLPACHLRRGYFAAAALPEDPERAARQLQRVAEALARKTSADQVLLMNGVDHQLPDPHTRAVAEALEKATGWEVIRGHFDAFVERLPEELPVHRGELLGGRVANLLPGVWSSRTHLKLRNRACESALEGWAEPWAALGRKLGLDDERPSLRLAWRALLQNQAHDSICGCSQDRVHEQMLPRYDTAQELAGQTTTRLLERLAGLPPDRQTPWTDELELAVFNPSPHPRTDRVRFAIDPVPALVPDAENLKRTAIHPLLMATLQDPGFEVAGQPARVVPSDDPGRYRLLENRPPLDVEFLARDVPAFGWKRFALRRTHAQSHDEDRKDGLEPAPAVAAHPGKDQSDTGRVISAGGVGASLGDDGSFDLRFPGASFRGLAALEFLGDRGDTYDFDPVTGGEAVLETLEVSRRRHASGIEALKCTRVFRVPTCLDESRSGPSERTVRLPISVEVELAPGLMRADLRIRVDNTARDHRLRLLFPTGTPAVGFLAATTFDVARRRPGPPEARNWIHPPPSTFPHQGWIHTGGLTVAAPGLPEGEVLADGTVAITLLRATGFLSRMDLTTRPLAAGPCMPTPGAQCPGILEARLSLFPGLDPRQARDAELGMACVVAGDAPLLPAETPVLELEPSELLLSCLKPADSGDGLILRVLNPTDEEREAQVRFGLPFETATPVGLDETPRVGPLQRLGDLLRFPVPAHALRSVRLD